MLTDFQNQFDSLTRDQLVSLTDADIARWIDLLGAEAGIPLLPDAPVAPEFTPPVHDVTHYIVAGIRLNDQQAASDLAAYINRLTCRRDNEYLYLDGKRYSYGNAVAFDKPVDEPVTVSTETLYSEGTAHAHRAMLQEQAALKKAYTDAKKHYDDVSERRERIVESVNDAIYKARRELTLTAEAERMFKRYLELANGNGLIASRFMRAADSTAAARIWDKLTPDVETEAPALPNPESEFLSNL